VKSQGNLVALFNNTLKKMFVLCFLLVPLVLGQSLRNNTGVIIPTDSNGGFVVLDFTNFDEWINLRMQLEGLQVFLNCSLKIQVLTLKVGNSSQIVSLECTFDKVERCDGCRRDSAESGSSLYQRLQFPFGGKHLIYTTSY
jgi:hypothetical protein